MSTAVSSFSPSTAFSNIHDRLWGGANMSINGLDKKYFAQSPSKSKTDDSTWKDEESSDEEEDSSLDAEEEEMSVARQSALSVKWVKADEKETKIVRELEEHQLPNPATYRSSHGKFDSDLYETDLQMVVRSAIESKRNDLWRLTVNSSEDYKVLQDSLCSKAQPVQKKSAIKSALKSAPDTRKVQTGRISFHPDVITSVLDRDDTICKRRESEFRGKSEDVDVCSGGVYFADGQKRLASENVRRDNMMARWGVKHIEDNCMSKSVAKLVGEPMVPIAPSTLDEAYPMLAKYAEQPDKGTKAYKEWEREKAAFQKGKHMTTDEMGEKYPHLLTALTKSGADSMGNQLWLCDWKQMTEEQQSVMLTAKQRSAMESVLESSKDKTARTKTKGERQKTQSEQWASTKDPEDGLKVAPFTMEELFSTTDEGRKLREKIGLEDNDRQPNAEESWNFRTKATGSKETLINLRKANKYFPLLSKWPMNKVAQDRCESQAVSGVNSYAKWATEYEKRYCPAGKPTVVLTTDQKSDYDRVTTASMGVSIGDKISGCTGQSCHDHCALHGNGLRKQRLKTPSGSKIKQRWSADSVASWWETTDHVAHGGTGLLLPQDKYQPHATRSERAERYGTVDKSNGTSGDAGTRLPKWTRQGDFTVEQ